jgi:hypothetical protein
MPEDSKGRKLKAILSRDGRRVQVVPKWDERKHVFTELEITVPLDQRTFFRGQLQKIRNRFAPKLQVSSD